MIISTPYDLSGVKRLLGDGSDYGVRFEFAEQLSPDGLARLDAGTPDFLSEASTFIEVIEK